MKPRLSLEELRSFVRQHFKKETLGFSSFKDGIPTGAITAISGAGKTELTLRFLAEHPALSVAWLEEKMTVHPFGFLQRGVSLGRVLFVEAAQQVTWAALQVLKAQVFKVVVISTQGGGTHDFRKIQLASEKAGAAVILLSPQPLSNWSVSLHLHAQKFLERIELQVLKRRF